MRYATPTRKLVVVMFAASAVACSERLTEPNVAPASASQSPTSSAATPTPALRDTAAATLAWQKRARDLASARGFSPLAAARTYALLGITQYGAAVAADRSLGIASADDDRSTMTGSDDGGRAQYEARRGAISAASRRILRLLFPNDTAVMRQQLESEAIGANGRIHPQFTRGVAIGESMGDVMVAWAKADGFSTPYTVPPFNKFVQDPLHPAQWWQAPDPMIPVGFQLPGMRAYFLTSNDQFRPAAPPVYLSPEYNAGLAAVRGISDTRTPEQIASANFWNFPAGTPTALGYWDGRASEYIAEHGLGERSASHVFALTNAAGFDALLGCWEAKYRYLLLRPTQADQNISLVFALPNHPSYPSGHSCVSAAAASVLSAFFPEKKAELDQGVADAGISRVFAGIHYPFDITAGQALGRSVAAWALDYDRTRGLLTAVGR